jgi:hypothetical protein
VIHGLGIPAGTGAKRATSGTSLTDLTSAYASLRLGAMDERPGSTPIENTTTNSFASLRAAAAL